MPMIRLKNIDPIMISDAMVRDRFIFADWTLLCEASFINKTYYFIIVKKKKGS